jgi:hypothetical protein
MAQRPIKTDYKTKALYDKFVEYCPKQKWQPCNFGDFSKLVRDYSQKVMRADGAEKTDGGSPVFDFSYETLYAKIVKRSKLITEDEIKDIRESMESNQLVAVENDVDDVFDFNEAIIKLQEGKIAELEKIIEELKKQLQTQQKVEEPEKEEKPRRQAKITNSTHWKAMIERVGVDSGDDE